MVRALPHGTPVSLISPARVADFDLTVQWRLPAGGNSGILYRVREDAEAPWQSGPEMQLLDDAGHPDGRVPETSCGALYGLFAPQVSVSCPADRFHVARVVARGPYVEHWLNGVRVLACDLSSDDFRQRAARSKFGAYPHFARNREGHLVLQHHGSEVCFRNVQLSP